MLTDWIYWLSSLHRNELLLLLSPLLMMDSTRYAIGSFALWICDFTGDVARTVTGRSESRSFDHVPEVCVIVAVQNGSVIDAGHRQAA